LGKLAGNIRQSLLLGRLPHLRVLTLSRNRLRQLPEELHEW